MVIKRTKVVEIKVKTINLGMRPLTLLKIMRLFLTYLADAIQPSIARKERSRLKENTL